MFLSILTWASCRYVIYSSHRKYCSKGHQNVKIYWTKSLQLYNEYQTYGFYQHGPSYTRIWIIPHTQTNIHSVEMIQRRGAWWVTSNYDWNNSVKAIHENLQWSTLSHWCTISRLKIFYNSFNDLSALKIPLYFTTTSYPNVHFISSLLQWELIHTNTAFFPEQ